MTPLGWLAIGAAVAVIAPPAGTARRARDLAGAGRLVSSLDGDVWPPRRAPWPRLAGAGAVAVVAVGVWAGGGWLGSAAGAVAGAGWLVVRGAVARRDAVARRVDLLSGVRVIVAELQAGARPGSALDAGADAAPRHAGVLRAAAAEAGQGGDPGVVLAGDPDTRVLGVAWRLGEDTGAALAGVLERVAADLAAADEQRRAVAVALAGPRSSAALLSGLPLLGIGLGIAMGARPFGFLVSAPAGRIVCCAGVLLDVAGVLWMRRILHRAERA